MCRFRRILAVITLAALFALPVTASGPDMLLTADAAAASVEVQTAPPTVSAESAILTDDTGRVLWSKQADVRMPMASTTKIMTALTVLSGGYDLEQAVAIPPEAVGVEGSSVYLYEGETLTVRQLLDAVLMESANDAATALAIACAGSLDQFSGQMNALAAEMGLCNTHFSNPHGLDHEDHYTTAGELADIARAAMAYDVFAETVATHKKEIPLKGGEGIRLLINHNKLLRSLDGCIGIKTGFTKKSGRCLVSACTRNGVTLYCVTLAAPDDWNDHRALYDWGFSQVEHVTLTEVGEQYAVLPVVGGALADGGLPGDGVILTVAVKNTDVVSMTLPHDHADIQKELRLPRFLYAPVTSGTQVGTAVYTCGGELLCEVPLYACEDVPLYREPTLWERIRGFFAGNR
ncbi:MAG: D-alanyl-D-alanine carboxypeptidase [Ruminococcaceae bacterium]|nr:D-alanyl-D-alanine carboxypeptidase [Oscillospiraceae bacterium]